MPNSRATNKKNITIYMTKLEVQLLHDIARKRKISMTEFIRRYIVKTALEDDSATVEREKRGK